MNKHKEDIYRETFKFILWLVLILSVIFGGVHLLHEVSEGRLNYEDKNMTEAFFNKHSKTMDSIGLKYIKEMGPERRDIEIDIDLKVLNLTNLEPKELSIGFFCNTPNTDLSYLLIDNTNKVLKMNQNVVAKYGKEAVFNDLESCLESTIKEVNKLKRRNDNLGHEFKLPEGK